VAIIHPLFDATKKKTWMPRHKFTLGPARRPDPGAGHDELIVKTVSVRRLPSLLLQTMDDELGTIARQDFLFGGLPLATVDSLFFLRPLCRQLLILGRDD